MHKRIRYIDMAKGICILLVVLGHELTWNDAARYFIYSFHIPMFFVLSGVTMRLTNECAKNKKDFMKKNLTGILYPYVIVSILYFLWDIINWFVSGKLSMHLIFMDLGQIVTGYGINVLWFLATLFLAKTIFYHLFRNKKKNYSIVCMLIVFLAGIILLFVVPALTRELPENLVGKFIEWGLISILRPVIAVFFLGVGYYGFPIFESKRKKKWMPVAVFLLVICFIPVFVRGKITLVNMISNPPFMVYLTGICGTIAVLTICTQFEKYPVMASILTYFGQNSLIIMLTHEYFPIRMLVQKMARHIIDYYFLQIILTFVVVLLIEMLICKLWKIFRLYLRRHIK